MSMNPFNWFGRKADKAYNDILAKADADMEREKARALRTWGNADPVVHSYIPPEFVGYNIPKKRPMLTQDMETWKAGIEARIAALEASIAAQPPEHSAKAQEGESDEELMKRFEAKVQESKRNRSAWIVFVGSRVWDLVRLSNEAMPMARYGKVTYRGVVVYYLEHEAEYYIG